MDCRAHVRHGRGRVARWLSRGVLAWGDGACFRARRSRVRGIRFGIPRHDAEPSVRHNEQRDAPCGTALRLHGCDARAGENRRESARQLECTVRRTSRRSRHFRHARWNAACGEHRDRRSDRRDDGPAVAADDVAARLQPEDRHGYDLRGRNARADHSAFDHSRAARRCLVVGLQSGPTQRGDLLAGYGIGRRFVRRRRDSGPGPRRALRGLSCGRCDVQAGCDAGPGSTARNAFHSSISSSRCCHRCC